MTKTIVQLANFVSQTSGGMKVAMDRLGAGYAAHGVRRVLVIPGSKTMVRRDESGITVQLASPKVNDTYRMIIDPGAVRQVLDHFSPDSVECCDKFTLPWVVGRWARKHGKRSVLFSHERLDDMASGWLPSEIGVRPGVHLLNRVLARAFDKIVVTTQYSAEEWADTKADLSIVPLGVDLSEFTFRPEPPAEERVQFCYAGRLSHEKHPQLAIATFKELIDRGVAADLHVYGTGVDESTLMNMASGYPVYFHGYLSSRADLAAAYGRADISLSVSPYETFGLAVLEALACGTAVITANHGGAIAQVDESCAVWAEPNPAALADAAQTLIARKGRALRAAARAKATEFSWDKAVNRMLDIHLR